MVIIEWSKASFWGLYGSAERSPNVSVLRRDELDIPKTRRFENLDTALTSRVTRVAGKVCDNSGQLYISHYLSRNFIEEHDCRQFHQMIFASPHLHFPFTLA